MDIEIRSVLPSDAVQIAEIYRPYVEDTAVTYEYDAPDSVEILRRIENTICQYPYFVAVRNNEVVGYAYAGALKCRKAYERSVETSIYVKQYSTRSGIGKLLYEALETELKKRGFTNMYACIAYPETEDEYLTFNSRCFHERMGFSLVGSFHKCAYKFGRWYGMIWMEKIIAEHE